jgi:hypothetical protein
MLLWKAIRTRYMLSSSTSKVWYHRRALPTNVILFYYSCGHDLLLQEMTPRYGRHPGKSMSLSTWILYGIRPFRLVLIFDWGAQVWEGFWWVRVRAPR